MARARHGALLLDTTGGADPDYVIWAKEVAGITRAWTFRHYKGTGTVGVMVATSNPVNPAPGDDLVKAVRDHILPLAPVAGGGLLFSLPLKKHSGNSRTGQRYPGNSYCHYCGAKCADAT